MSQSDPAQKPGGAPSAAAPAFSSRNAAEASFWDERFAQGFTPWDFAGVPAEFQVFAAGTAPCPVLVPGCGNGWEAAWLFERGWPVTAIDFSHEAVMSARRVLGPAAAVVQEADFFAFTPEPPCRLIYERAFLCALPTALRAAYGRRVAELLPPGGLLAGYFYIGENRGGPPFAMPQAELDALLAPAFERIDDRPSAAPLPVFAGQERWQVWRRRSD